MNRRMLLQGLALSSIILPRLGEAMEIHAMGPVEPSPEGGSDGFDVRSLEFHSDQMWQWRSVDRGLRMMERLKLNTLIFHQRDMTDYLVLPRAYFSPANMRRYAPVRRTTMYDYRYALRRAVAEAKKRQMKLFIEVNEIYYPDGIVEMNPQLSVNGSVCPTDPFWWEFEKKKYEEILEEIPDIDGVIVSPGTVESRLTIAGNSCTCARCRDYDPAMWYHNLTQSIYEPLHARGKLLVIRDFSSTRSNQSVLVQACASVAKDIILSLKITPQDFYPTFPNNPLIGAATDRTQWVEFDMWGQFFGHGFFPCSLVEDTQQRLIHCKKNKVTGVSFRIDWECTTDTDIFNSFNLVNLIAGGMLAENTQTNIDDVYRSWLEYGLLDPLLPTSVETPPVPVVPADMGRIRDFMKASWEVMKRTMFVRGLVFASFSSMFPESVDSTMVASTGIDAWIPGASESVKPTDENIQIIMAEKEQAEQDVKRLSDILRVSDLQVPASLKSSLTTMLDLYHTYVVGFKYCAAAYFKTKKAMQTRQANDIAEARRAADDLLTYKQQTARMLSSTSLPHYAYLFFSLESLDLLAEDVRSRMNSISPA